MLKNLNTYARYVSVLFLFGTEEFNIPAIFCLQRDNICEIFSIFRFACVESSIGIDTIFFPTRGVFYMQWKSHSGIVFPRFAGKSDGYYLDVFSGLIRRCRLV